MKEAPFLKSLQALSASNWKAMSEPCAERDKTLAFDLGFYLRWVKQGKDGRPQKRVPKKDLILTRAVYGNPSK
jgi:hypothetical protein